MSIPTTKKVWLIYTVYKVRAKRLLFTHLYKHLAASCFYVFRISPKKDYVGGKAQSYLVKHSHFIPIFFHMIKTITDRARLL